MEVLSKFYNGAELRPYTGRPDAAHALELPSRVGRRLYYRDGRMLQVDTPTAPLAQPPVLPNADAHPATRPLKKPRLSIKDAQPGIAEAMQGIEAGQVPCPDAPTAKSAPAQKAGQQGISQAPVHGELPVGLAIGQQVKVLANVRPVQEKFVGMQGQVIRPLVDRTWAVKLKSSKGKPGGEVYFDVSELEVIS